MHRGGQPAAASSGRPVAIEQMLTMLGELTGKSPRIRVDPARLRDDDPQVSYGDYGRLHQVTGWQPRISLRDSLAAMLAALSDERS